jgi:NTP pyrophosphatase (non-canonical NTP hydrolase)|tara:strand:- start:23555 stop:23956 length:402 start_codon:yes stop_codon:yes gene_type:complete
MEIDLNKYKHFVDAVTSKESKDSAALVERWRELNKFVETPRLLTASIGLGSESGEFSEIVKKCIFQGKPLDEDTKHHLKRELGDIMWYWAQACLALHLDPNDVIIENVEKLKSRYPGGEFDASKSEQRKEGDI